MAAYSFKDVVATITGPGGVVNFGYGAGIAEEGITLEPTDDKDAMVIGADGTPMHTLRAAKSGTATVRVLKTSPTNALLQAMYDFQTLSSANWGQNIIVVANNAAGDVTTCRSVAFKRVAGNAYAKDAAMMEWAFNCGEMDRLLGVTS